MSHLKVNLAVYRLHEFSKLGNTVHGFSTRQFYPLTVRDLWQRTPVALQFASQVGFDLEKVVAMDQVHGDRIAMVDSKDTGKLIGKTDGLVTREKGVYLAIKTADCAPLLFYEIQKQIIAVAHAGWKGGLKKIAGKVVHKMKDEFGADTSQILVGIGPTIGACCYHITRERLDLFKTELGADLTVYSSRKKQIFLDLPLMIIKQLVKAGIKESNIENGAICTVCFSQKFYSRRADMARYGKLQGEIIGILGMRRQINDSFQ